MKTWILFVLSALIGGLSACSHTRSPTDEQLLTLLRNDLTRNPKAAPVDVTTVRCLRAWSENRELIAGLAADFAAESDGKRSCRTRIDGWIADATRNPAKFTFEDIAAPKTVRRVMALVDAHDKANAAAIAQAPHPSMPPPALLNRSNRPGAQATGAGMTDLGTAQALLQEADTECKSAKGKAAQGNAPVALQRFARYCDSYVSRAQATLASGTTLTPQQIDAIARGAKGITSGAQRALQEARQD